MLKAVIIDDEKDAIDGLEIMLQGSCPDIILAGHATSAAAGIELIRRQQPDLVFLDIEMPHGNGFKVLEAIPGKQLQVIFVTAYDQYAIQAIKFNACDYLLKPANPEEVALAVDRARENIRSTQFTNYQRLLEQMRSRKLDKIALPTSHGFLYVNTEDIIRIEADKSYSTIYIAQRKPVIVSQIIKFYEELLSDKGFFRIHKKHLINMKHVDQFFRTDGAYVVMSDQTKVEISRRNKDAFLLAMQS